MASVDGSRSLQGACDEVYDIVCGPCKTDKVDREANNYCTECKEYLCNHCKDSHLKFKMSKHHKILSGREIPELGTHIQRTSCVVYCSCNQNQEVSVFCEKHEEVICNSCKTVKHRNCKLFSIQEKGVSYTSTRFTTFITKAKALKDKLEKLQNQRRADQGKLATLKETCKKDISTFRKEINTFFDTLEQTMLDEMDKSDKEQQVYIEQHLSSLATTLHMLDIDYKLLEDAKQDGNKETMFASEIKVSKGLMEYEGVLVDLQKEVGNPLLSFKRNKKLNDMQTEVQTLGSIKCKNVVLGMKIKSSDQVNVKLADDNNTPIITGCSFISNKYAVLCDRANCSIKLMDETMNYKSKLKLPANPGDVAAIDDDNIIVTLPETKQVQYVQVFPKLEARRVVQLDKSSYGVCVSADEIFTTCHNNPGQGEVRVYDLSGIMKRKVGVYRDGQFKSPNYIAVNKSTKKIFVSDDVTSTVTCMTSGGDIIYQYKDLELKGIGGVHVDADDNVVVCDTDSDRVLIISAHGRKYADLLSSTDGLSKPYSIAYRGIDETLVVGCYYKNSLFCFKLE